MSIFELFFTLIGTLLLTCLIFTAVDICVNFKFVGWWLSNRLWRKRSFHYVSHIDGEIGIEIMDGYILVLPSMQRTEYYTPPPIFILSSPNSKKDNRYNIYDHGFRQRFCHMTLSKSDSFDSLKLSGYMMRHLSSLYSDDLKLIEDMKRL